MFPSVPCVIKPHFRAIRSFDSRSREVHIIISKMDAFMEQSWQASQFRKAKLLYLYCVDLNYICELTVPSLPFLFMKCFFGHVSFPGALEERRVVVLPQGECKRVMDKLKDVGSPCVIEVTASVDFQVRILISGEVLLLYVSLSVN